MTSSSFDQGDASARLIQVCQELLSERRLILLSNRGPVEYRLSENGALRPARGPGGVVTALSTVSRYVELTWIASAMGEGDRRTAERAEGEVIHEPLPGQKLHLRFVVTPRAIYHKYYNVFCNPLLWFIHHYMWNPAHTPNVDAKVYDAWENGYIPVNQAFAEAAVQEAAHDDLPPVMMLHDYHLYLSSGLIREKVPKAILQQFIHTPWPSPDYWQLLPEAIRRPMFESLCANDIVGLQTMRDVRNFLHTCEDLLDEVEIDREKRLVWFKGHPTQVVSYPISIDVSWLQRVSRSVRVQQYRGKLRPYQGEQTIMRVDRAEPSKNIVRGLRAFAMLLERYPDLVGKVKLLSFLVPSRTHIKQYQRYTQEIFALVDAINERFGTEEYKPIQVMYENNYPQAIAGMCFYDVLVVNAVIDGMNLVAKEGPTVNTRDGVLILSEGVGAHEQLREGALTVSPTDLEGMVQALYAALTMEPEERKRRANLLRETVAAADITVWLLRQFEDLKKLTEKSLSRAM